MDKIPLKDLLSNIERTFKDTKVKTFAVDRENFARILIFKNVPTKDHALFKSEGYEWFPGKKLLCK